MAAETLTSNGSSDGNLAATYALIYAFLIAHSHAKAAAAVKKAVKDIVVLKDNVPANDDSLDEIVKWWKEKKAAEAENESDSDSSDSSSDDDSSSSSSSESDSSSDSLDSSKSPNAKKDLDSPKAAKAAKTNGQAAASHTVASNHKSNPGNHQSKPSKKPDNPIFKKSGKPTKSRASSSSDSSRSGDSDSDSSESELATISNSVNQAAAYTSKSEPTVVADVSAVRTTKKRRISESGNAVITATVTETSSPAPNQNGKANGKNPRKSSTPFQRIKADAVEYHDERLKDNAFVARGASANDYGTRANHDLIVTRGDSFRKEKNKKKRGSYRGGEITMQSHSIKFN